ncbi:MAG: glycosyltransferase family 39 protein, partial [Chloroflexota bacterium]
MRGRPYCLLTPAVILAGMGVAAVVLLGFALRLWRLAHLGDLEFDEIVSVRYAALPAGELLPRLAGALFEHPPAFYLALGWWQSALGESDTAARLASTIPGTLTIPLAFAVARRLFDRRTGLVAALLVAIAPLPLFYSREARMYALVACLALASLWLFLRGLAAAHADPGTEPHRCRDGSPLRAPAPLRRSSPRSSSGTSSQIGLWIAYTLVGALTAYVHYLGALLIA